MQRRLIWDYLKSILSFNGNKTFGPDCKYWKYSYVRIRLHRSCTVDSGFHMLSAHTSSSSSSTGCDIRAGCVLWAVGWTRDSWSQQMSPGPQGRAAHWLSPPVTHPDMGPPSQQVCVCLNVPELLLHNYIIYRSHQTSRSVTQCLFDCVSLSTMNTW